MEERFYSFSNAVGTTENKKNNKKKKPVSDLHGKQKRTKGKEKGQGVKSCKGTGTL